MRLNTSDIWEMIGNIPIGKVVVWGLVICSIIASLYKAISKLYGLFEKYKALHEENERQRKVINNHDIVLSEINKSLEEIKHSFDELNDVNLKQIRYAIVHTCDDAISAGYITAGKLRSVEELFEEYTNVFHGNGYVKTLVEKVRILPVKGRIDE